MEMGFMDELRPLLAIFAFISLVACAKDKTPESVAKPLNKLQLCGGTVAPHRYIVEWENGTYTVESAASYESFKAGFVTQNLSAIREVQPDVYFVKDSEAVALPLATPGDDHWGQELVGVSELWAQGLKGLNVTVGIVDSFVDVNHEALESQIAYNKLEIPDNGIDDDRNGFVDDYKGQSFISMPAQNAEKSKHGTHVSGIVVGAHYLGHTKGVAPDARIVAAPFINDDNMGYFGDALLALQYVVDRGAKVVNLSWGGPTCEPKLRSLLATLGARGVLFTVAAGNGEVGSQLDLARNPRYPAAYDSPTQITVSATSRNDILMPWSFYSTTYSHLAAPGESILSALPMNQYAFSQGTSMAAPFVAGAAAILWSAVPSATVQQVKTALLTGIDRSPLKLAVFSEGRLNVAKALAKLRAQVEQP